MCGIVGYIGEQKAERILIDALKRLEYRGYDSAGIATLHKGKIKLIKKPGRLTVLEEYLNTYSLPGTIGIGHTRWATHGAPSEVNAHPHSDCSQSLVVVHNGIIENFQELKERLIKEGHIFTSQTDTEVIAHLIEKYLNKNNNLEEATCEALKCLTGAYAISIISSFEPHKMVAARNGSPLVVGLGEDENFVASDVPAILNHTRKVIFLEDKELVVVTKDKIKIMDFNLKTKDKPITYVKWSQESAEKGGFPHFMLKEIFEQSEVINNTLRGRISSDKKRVILPEIEININPEKLKIEKIFIVACGTAYHAGLVSKYFFENFLNLMVEVEVASEFRYRKPKIDENSLCIAISQSGETADTLASVREFKQKGGKVLSICNVVGSTLTREADGTIYTMAGPEICVASTKAYVAQLTALYLLGIYLAQSYKLLKEKDIHLLIKELLKVPLLAKKILEQKKHILNLAQKYWQTYSTLYLGRGYNFPNALEGALKLKEISYIHAEGYPAGEMKHGPIALIDEKMPVVCIAVKDNVYEKMISNIQEVRARGGKVIAIATSGDKKIKEYVEDVIYIPQILECFSPILVVIPLQLFAYYIAAKRGCDIDRPRNLAKSVTVE